jgi:hypothetical protein
MGKTIRQMLTNKAKGTRIHTEAEVFSKMRYTDDVQAQVKESIASGSLTKGEKLGAVKMMTRTAYEDASEDIKALCRAKVQAERDAKASEVLKKTDEAPTNAQYAMYEPFYNTPALSCSMGDFIGHLPNVWVRFHNSCKSLRT